MKKLLHVFGLWLACNSLVYANLANPLPVGLNETWFLIADGPRKARAEQHNWKTGKINRFEIDLPTRDHRDDPRRYALAANKHGLWIAENTLALLRPDGKTQRIDNFFPEPPDRGMTSAESVGQSVLVSLADDSVLLLSKLRGRAAGKIFRLRWQDRAIKVEELSQAPRLGWGISATRLSDGRVLMVSGDGGQNRSWLYDPSNNSWAESGKLNVNRMSPALAALADGRAFIAGNNSSALSKDRLESAHGAEIWDPATQRWAMLPTLPMSLYIEAHGVSGASATVMPDGSLVLGGAMHSRLLILHRRGDGFAPYWRISDPMAGQRVGAIIQAISPDEVMISGGRMLTESRQCCRTRTDSERLRLPRLSDVRRSSVGLQRHDAATAQRGPFTFVAGGWEAFQLSFATVQASAVAELIDHRNGTVRELPSLPGPLLTGKAAWLDDDRILVKAIAHPALYEQGFGGNDGRSLEFNSTGYFSVFSVKRNTWKPLNEPDIAVAELAGIAQGEAILVSPAAQVWAVNPETSALRALPRPLLTRSGGVSRVLSDGRLVLAGGNTPSELIEAYDADCQRRDCPLQKFAYGSVGPSRIYETFDPSARKWTTSATSKNGSFSAVIRRDGRVITLGRNEHEWMIEQSDVKGKSWKWLRLPSGLGEDNCGSDKSTAKCILLLGNLPDDVGEAVLLVQTGWDNKAYAREYHIWLWDDKSAQWNQVVRGLPENQLLGQKIKLLTHNGKTVFGMGFQPNQFQLLYE